MLFPYRPQHEIFAFYNQDGKCLYHNISQALVASVTKLVFHNFMP
jgi:hypothetical protein